MPGQYSLSNFANPQQENYWNNQFKPQMEMGRFAASGGAGGRKVRPGGKWPGWKMGRPDPSLANQPIATTLGVK